MALECALHMLLPLSPDRSHCPEGPPHRLGPTSRPHPHPPRRRVHVEIGVADLDVRGDVEALGGVGELDHLGVVLPDTVVDWRVAADWRRTDPTLRPSA